MADKYIDATYVDAFISQSVRESLTADYGIDLDVIIESATALVKGKLRNSGYSTPSTSTDAGVMSAVMAATWLALAAQPASTLKLPEDWKSLPLFQSYAEILSGDYQCDPASNHALTSADAVGGWSFSDSTSGSTTALPQRTSRSNLAGY